LQQNPATLVEKKIYYYIQQIVATNQQKNNVRKSVLRKFCSCKLIEKSLTLSTKLSENYNKKHVFITIKSG
jgi:hypothetical protein